MTDHLVQTLADATAPELVTELPGPEARRVIEQDLAVTSPSMPRVYPLVPRRAEGCVIEDVDGNRFLDLNAGIAVTATGHCHPAVVAAIEEQAERMLHYCSSDFYHPVYSELCQRLAALAPFGGAPARVFLGNSGTEAVEAAIKLARHHTGRANLVAFLGGFHGRTMGSLSLTASKARYRAGFGPLLPGVHHVPYGMAGLEQLQTQLFRHLVSPEEVAAIVVEPVQGEGGYVPAPDGFLAGLRALCDEHGILLVADEVQSGIGRTGQFWAIEHDGVQPDIVLAGKGLASGLPLGALIARADVMTWPAGTHGSTFGGNPVSCAAALATIDLVESGLAGAATDRGAQLLAGVQALIARQPLVEAVRGRGLMIGLDLADHDVAVALEQECFRRGLLVLTCGERSVRLAPPLVIRPDQVDTAVGLLEEAITSVGAAG
jgi:4-aminobutyrate aminotransferase